ncbi:hypothetical protein LCGC14_3148880 [marine sediment metagenome]|uniref:Uncharacterized protein n=1 Tax=marine sediment metagenome TaxID=412755 RepID=A0A0F8YIZ7_9ZZZZ
MNVANKEICCLSCLPERLKEMEKRGYDQALIDRIGRWMGEGVKKRMREELDKILSDSLKWSCKHHPCPEEKGCIECATVRILSLLADEVRGAGNPFGSKEYHEEFNCWDAAERFRDSLLKELK